MKLDRTKTVQLAVAAVAIGAAVSILYLFAPERYGFYPRCMLYTLTGLQCPGCGGLRATHHLLHGDLSGAWKLNPLIVVMAATGPIFLPWFLVRRNTAGKRARLMEKPIWLWSLLAALIVFVIVRNLVR